MPKSTSYEPVAHQFLAARSAIGTTTVQAWAQSLPKNSNILDLGCGSGIPISKAIANQGHQIFGIEPSPTLVTEFRQNLPHHQIQCESFEQSDFYKLQFEASIAWGLIFLLEPSAQINLIMEVAQHLKPDGRFLFTAPAQIAEWQDLLLGMTSRSLGEQRYREILEQNGLEVTATMLDEGENHYYSCRKTD